MRTLIKNVTVLTIDPERHVYPNGYVIIEDGKIAEVGEDFIWKKSEKTDRAECSEEGKKLEQEFGFDEIVDGHGGILMPGMINVHTHLSMIPFRSMGDDCPDRLRRFLFPLELEEMTPKLVYRAARYAVCESLLSGVTAVTDMYYFEDEVAKACEELGICAWVGETIIDQETCDSKNTTESLKLCEEFIQKWQGHKRIHPMVAPHATNTNPPEVLKAAYDLSLKYNTLYTLHVSEMDYEMKYFADVYGKTPIQFLDEIGVLGKNTIAAHCIHMKDEDMKRMAERGAKIAHCVGANTKSGKGISPIYEAKQAGVLVGIGTDGPSSGNTLDLFTQFKMIPYLQKTKYHDRSIFHAKEVVEMGTIKGAEILGAESEMGSIEIGKRANLVLIETESVNMFPIYNPYSAIVYSANAGNVDSVWVDGKCLVKGHKLLGTDLCAEREMLENEMKSFRIRAEEYSEVI